MLSNLYTSLIVFFITVSSFLSAVDYEIHDIGTLQTHSSKAIAINNQGQILGWYNIDGSKEGKHFFVRDQDGSFHEVPSKENDFEINWRSLTNDGIAYGTFDGNANFAVLYGWNQKDGLINLGDLPGKEIAKINDAGQVLIKSVVENESGKSTRRPVIWHNGKITKLRGLEGDLGIESDESYGYDMNNNGDVVGQSVVYLSHKNNLYRQTRATKWINGLPIDLQKVIPKTNESSAICINDKGELLVDIFDKSSHDLYFISTDGSIKTFIKPWRNFFNNSGYSYAPEFGSSFVYDCNDNVLINTCSFNEKLKSRADSIWLKMSKMISVNDNGEIISHGVTIYGEEHAMLLVPVKAD